MLSLPDLKGVVVKRGWNSIPSQLYLHLTQLYVTAYYTLN